jgi:hypothetical protein
LSLRKEAGTPWTATKRSNTVITRLPKIALPRATRRRACFFVSFEILETLRFGDDHAAELLWPTVERCLTDAVRPTDGTDTGLVNLRLL